jgi:hypothetical protein
VILRKRNKMASIEDPSLKYKFGTSCAEYCSVVHRWFWVGGVQPKWFI